MKKDIIWVTGGAGFIGSHFILAMKSQYPEFEIWNIDALRYSADLDRLKAIDEDMDYQFIHADIGDAQKITSLFQKTEGRLKYIVHFAAQTHVDRAIQDSEPFIQDNVIALETFLSTWSNQKQSDSSLQNIHFLYISTDEVYGSLMPNEPPFDEMYALSPSNPYSLSKYQAEEIVRKYAQTQGLSYLITRSTNNIGVGQHLEKLIPKMLNAALSGQPMTIYGDGLQMRDWIDVRDHVQALIFLLFYKTQEDVYNIGAGQVYTNIDLVKQLCSTLEQLKPSSSGSYQALIQYVADRPGHDIKYALDVQKINQLGWKAIYSLEQSIFWVVQDALDKYL